MSGDATTRIPDNVAPITSTTALPAGHPSQPTQQYNQPPLPSPLTTTAPNPHFPPPIHTPYHNGTASSSFGQDMMSKSQVSPTRSSSGSIKGKNGTAPGSDGKPKPHICHVCNKGFTTGGHLQRHQRIHTGVKAFKCPYPGCETRTSRQDNLQQHYRTHLSPSLRRGSGSAARAAVNAAMEAAGLKSANSRAPRKKSGSTASSHQASPYSTPTSQSGSGTMPYPPYPMYNNYNGYHYPFMNNPSSSSSRGPSPGNGSSHSSIGSMPGHGPPLPPPHQAPPQFYNQQFSNAYPYGPGPGHGGPTTIPGHGPPGPGPGMGPGPGHNPYRYAPPPDSMQGHYGAPPPPPHTLYSPGIAPDHLNGRGPAQGGHGPGGGPGQTYSPMPQSGFPTHSRESSFSVITPGYPGGSNANSINNGYPSRTQSTTPLSHGHTDEKNYTPPSTRRSPPDMLSQGVVDPSTMNRSGMHHQQQQQQSYGMNMGYNNHQLPPMQQHGGGGNGGGHHPHHLGAYAYGNQPSHFGDMLHSRNSSQRASISSLSEDSGAGMSEGSGQKPMIPS